MRFRFKLALALGKSLAEIDALPAAEFNQWRAYDRLFPFGDERADWRMGNVVAAMMNIHTKGQRRSASDFMLKPPETQKQKEGRLRSALKSAGRRKKA